jgi:hypothetical protein
VFRRQNYNSGLIIMILPAASLVKVDSVPNNLLPFLLAPFIHDMPTFTPCVTNLQGPPSERTPEEKLWDFKTRAQQYARDRESCDDVRISYLEFLETEAEDDLALARMIAG